MKTTGLSRALIPFTSAAILSLIIWFIGPQLTIGHHLPFASISNRILSTIILLLVALIIYLKKSLSLPVNDNKPSHQTVTAIFRLAKQFMLRHRRWWQYLTPQKFHQPNFLLMIGPAKAGKTQLLTKEQLQANDEQHAQLQNNQICNWWFTKKSIILDINAQSLAVNNDKLLANTIWSSILKQLKKITSGQLCQGLIIMISLDEILTANEEQKQQLISGIKQHIQLLNQHVNHHYPLYFIINKADHLAGFCEFFGDFSKEEREQTWGINFDASQLEQTSLNDCFQQQYEALIDRLNQRLIWRLHQERDFNKRCLIKDFPLQLENIQTDLSTFINHCLNDFAFDNKAMIQGVYFTSATQTGKAIDRLQEPLSKAFSLEPRQLTIHHADTKPYFSNELFNNIIFQNRLSNLGSHSSRRFAIDWQKLFAYVASASAIVIVAWYCAQGLSSNNNKIMRAQSALNQYEMLQLNHKSSIKDTLQALNAITNVVSQLNHSHGFGEHHLNTLNQQATQAYHQALLTQLLPRLRDYAYHQLFYVSVRDPQAVYRNLSIYLMLSDNKHIDIKLLKSWLDSAWLSHHYARVSIKILNQHLSVLTTLDLPKAKTNTHLVKLARKILSHLSYPQRTFVILTNQLATHTPQTLFSRKAKIFMGPYSEIPFIYTAQGFKDITQQDFLKAAKQATVGNWVLGHNDDVDFSPSQFSSIAQQTKTMYVKLYTEMWKRIISGTQLQPTLGLPQTAQLLHKLSANNSPLTHLLRRIVSNTQVLTQGQVEQNKVFISALNDLARISNNNNGPLLNTLNNFANYLNTIVNQHHVAQAAFAAVKARLLNSPQDPLSNLKQAITQLPYPLNNWFRQLQAHTWQMLMAQTHAYIEQQWQHQIVPFYQAKLADRFPLTAHATAQIKLSDFISFFNPTGKISHFYSEYLAPFINTKTQRWQLVTIDGENLGISDSSLLQLQLSSYIAQMYFPEGNDKLAIHFTLQPLNIEPIVNKFLFDMNGQQVTYNRQNVPAQTKLSWPGKHSKLPLTKVYFQTVNGSIASHNYAGPWGLFKALAHANVKATDNPLRYALTFDINGNAVKYLLVTEHTLNPFIGHVVDEFKLPETL